MQDICLRKPDFGVVWMFYMTLFRPIKTSEKASEKLLRFLKNDPNITIVDLAKMTGVTTRSVEMQLKKLKEMERIVRIVPTKVDIGR